MPSQPTIQNLQTAVANEPALLEAIQADPIKGTEQAAVAAEKYTKETTRSYIEPSSTFERRVLIITVLSPCCRAVRGDDDRCAY